MNTAPADERTHGVIQCAVNIPDRMFQFIRSLNVPRRFRVEKRPEMMTRGIRFGKDNRENIVVIPVQQILGDGRSPADHSNEMISGLQVPFFPDSEFLNPGKCIR